MCCFIKSSVQWPKKPLWMNVSCKSGFFIERGCLMPRGSEGVPNTEHSHYCILLIWALCCCGCWGQMASAVGEGISVSIWSVTLCVRAYEICLDSLCEWMYVLCLYHLLLCILSVRALLQNPCWAAESYQISYKIGWKDLGENCWEPILNTKPISEKNAPNEDLFY